MKQNDARRYRDRASYQRDARPPGRISLAFFSSRANSGVADCGEALVWPGASRSGRALPLAGTTYPGAEERIVPAVTIEVAGRLAGSVGARVGTAITRTRAAIRRVAVRVGLAAGRKVSVAVGKPRITGSDRAQASDSGGSAVHHDTLLPARAAIV